MLRMNASQTDIEGLYLLLKIAPSLVAPVLLPTPLVVIFPNENVATYIIVIGLLSLLCLHFPQTRHTSATSNPHRNVFRSCNTNRNSRAIAA